MKALLDEQLPPRIAELLRDRGHDVQAVVDRSDLAGRSDRVILEIAAAEERAVITNNVKGFRPLVSERLAWAGRGERESHAGLILLPFDPHADARRCREAGQRDRTDPS